MKPEANKHDLGRKFNQGSQDWFHLVIEEDGKWRVDMEKDYDEPFRKGYTTTIPPAEYDRYSTDDGSLQDAITQKLISLGLDPN